ncbi:MAG: RdgB/HAM1 family non-canonical purine NTP pyrophosphatase [Alphaproteobacteria bacterium]|nr:RdgB/HAM1 family non-canonical purine NTP pyrophosphatase [Alphaproteobacteria bacterium]
MARAFAEPRLVLASHNNGKLREIRELLAPLGRDVVSAQELDLPEPDETGETFVANAVLKARAAVAGSGLAALADDSGIEVAALNGAPGIYTARWAGEPRDFMVAMTRVNDELGVAQNRRANFTAVLALCWPDGHCETFEGKVFGTLVWPPRGDRGFGFDPMFVPDGYDVTFGEMDPAVKHAISHRAGAFKKLLGACFGDNA